MWKRAETNGSFGAFFRLLLLTGQRREKVAAMRWEDIKDGVWTIPSEAREKGTAGRASSAAGGFRDYRRSTPLCF